MVYVHFIKCKKAYLLTPCYADIREKFSCFCRIYPPEYFKNKYGADEAYHVDQVRKSALLVYFVNCFFN